jgi:hypothetical protein
MKRTVSYIVAAAVIGLSAYAFWLDRAFLSDILSGPQQDRTPGTAILNPEKPSLPKAKDAETEDNLDQALNDLGSLPK